MYDVFEALELSIIAMVMAEVKTHMNLQIKVGVVGGNQGTSSMRS